MRNTLIILAWWWSCYVAQQTLPPPTAQERAASAADLFAAWAKRVERDYRLGEEDPIYQLLLVAPNSDLAFLNGLDYPNQEVRTKSSRALGRLNTSRTFNALAPRLRSQNMFERQSALETLGNYRGDCADEVVLRSLISDAHSQIRWLAAYKAATHDTLEIRAALLQMLYEEPCLAPMAAQSLGALQVDEAIEPTGQLVLACTDWPERAIALSGIRQSHSKAAVPALIDLLEYFTTHEVVNQEYFVQCIDSDLIQHAYKTSKLLGPTPDRIEQWRAWWSKAAPLFTSSMALPETPRPTFTLDECALDPDRLTLSVALNVMVHRMGDPIRIDLEFTNRSDRPCSVVMPGIPSGWWPTMGFGVRLERLDNNPIVLIDLAPSGFYQGSYSGPPSFKILAPAEVFRSSFCLQTWLAGQRVWPLANGAYRLTVSFDSTQFPGITANQHDLLGSWSAKPVEFEIMGAPRRDPEEVLRIVGELVGLPWILTDLTSRRTDRREAAWWAVSVYGDARLTPILAEASGDRPWQSQMRRYILRPAP